MRAQCRYAHEGTRSSPESDTAAVADHRRLARDNRCGRCLRPGVSGRGGEAVPHSVVFDGANAPLCEARRLLRRSVRRPRDRQPSCLQVRRPEAWTDCRLHRSESGRPVRNGKTAARRSSSESSDSPARRSRSADGVIYINGKRLVEPYVEPSRRGHESGSWPRVAKDHYFVVGDNRVRSCDSRAWGTVPRSSLIGPVMLTYWPPSRVSSR